MGLRKLTDRSSSAGGTSESAGSGVTSGPAAATPPPSVESDPTDDSRSLPPAIWTDVSTPAELDEAESASAPGPEANTAEPSKQVDAFMASLEALRATLRASRHYVPLEPESPDAPGAGTPPVQTDAVAQPTEVEPVSVGLEGMPLPAPIAGPTPTPRPAPEPAAPAKTEKRRDRPTAVSEARETPSLESALMAVRKAVPGLAPAESRPVTPVPGRQRPASDGIPASASEDLPKYPAKPRMRTCTRCGHETKLRDAKCQKCSHVDESLGILEAVIAGDLARVEQVLLVRPHLITMRTSRHDWTLLHMAASGGNPKMVELLIQKGVSVNAVNRDGKTALHYAAAKGHLGIVQALLNNHADAAVLYKGRSALDLAVKNGRGEVEAVLRRHLIGN